MSSLKVTSPKALKGQVIVGKPVAPSEVDAYARKKAADDKSEKLRVLLAAWEKQHQEERELRKTYAKWLLIGLGVQSLVVNFSFLALGLRWIEVEKWTADVFIMAVFAEIAAMTFWIVKFLFPKVGTDALSVLEKL